MTDYIKRADAIKAIIRKHDEVLSVAEAIEDLESVPSADVVTREQYEQIHWERDVALHQLEEIGKGLGEKMVDVIERSDDTNTSNALNALDCVEESEASR